VGDADNFRILLNCWGNIVRGELDLAQLPDFNAENLVGFCGADLPEVDGDSLEAELRVLILGD